MKTTLTTAAVLLLTTAAAQAGGIDRGGNAYGALFEDGNYVELSFSSVSPDISGDYAAPLNAFGASTENMAESYVSIGAALKYQFTDQISVGLFLNMPYGANANYTGGAYTGLGADWESKQVAAVLKYQVNDNISVYGGARSVESSAVIQIPNPAAGAVYNAEAESDRQTSYIAGVAYERKDIALRVALTYESGFTHEFNTTETVNGFAITPGTVTEIEMPQSITLDFQTGVAADTLVFGSIRWSEWSVWEVRPAGYEGLTGGRVTGLDNDVTTFRLGVGRRLNENLSVFGRVTYEGANGGVASRLAPTDGSTAFGVGGTYTKDNMKVTGGIEYVMLGDATDGSGTAFTENSAIGFGVSIGTSF